MTAALAQSAPDAFETTGLVPVVVAQNTEQGASALTGVAPPGPQRKRKNVLPAPTEAAQGGGLLGWGLPPIRWGGAFTNDFRVATTEGQRQTQQMGMLNLKASSYVWQPWFAQVSGGLTLTGVQSSSSGDASSAASSQSKAKAVTGNAMLALLPRSYFPFTASIDVADSRTSGELTRNDYTSTRVALTQRYTPPEGGGSYSLRFDRSMLESDTAGKDTAQALSASMSRAAGRHSISANASQYSNSRSNTGDRSDLSRVDATHSFQPSSTLSVNSFANIISSDYRLGAGNAAFDSRSQFLQLNSMATWRPAEDSPLFFIGGARLFQSTASISSAAAGDSVAAESGSLSANAAVTYRRDRNTTLNAAAMVTQANSAGTRTLLSTQSAGASYNADSRALGDYTYNWNAAANATNMLSSGAATDGGHRNFGLNAGHTLRRAWVLNPVSTISFDIGQNLSATQDSTMGVLQTLGHTASAHWRGSPSEASSIFVSLTGYDTRTQGRHSEQYFQMVNLQVSGQMQLGRHSSVGANLTTQGSRQATVTANNSNTGALAAAPFDSSRFAFSSSGTLNYQNTRFFGVPKLRYSALYTANQAPSQTRFEGNIDAPIERISQALEQRLEYNIGRIDARLSLRVAEMQGRTEGLLMLRISRPFGAY